MEKAISDSFALVLLALIASCPFVLVMTGFRIFNPKQRLSNRLPFLLVLAVALWVFSKEYERLGLYHQLEFSRGEILGPVASAGLAATATYVLLSSVFRMLSPKMWLSERLAFLLVLVVALLVFVKEYVPLVRNLGYEGSLRLVDGPIVDAAYSSISAFVFLWIVFAVAHLSGQGPGVVTSGG